jgi:uncharacterized protein YggE
MENSILQSTLVKKATVASLVLLSVFLLGKSLNEFKQYSGNPSNLNTITVSGEGEVFAIPDLATFSFSILGEGKTVPEAQKKATEKNNAVIKMLKDEGVAEKDIVSQPSVNPKYASQPCTGWSCPTSSEIVGYQANYYITVKLRDAEKAGDITAKLAVLNVSNLSGVSYTIDNDEALRQEARTKAIEDAREEAKKLAKDLGVRLSEIVSFSEGGQGYQADFMSARVMKAESAAGAVPAPDLPMGENRISSTVSVTFKID